MTSSRFDLFGLNVSSLQEGKRMIESATGRTLELRDSSYSGVYYADLGPGVSYLTLKQNAPDGRWYTKYPSYTATLMVGYIDNMDGVKAQLIARDEIHHLETIIVVAEEDDDEDEDEEPEEEDGGSS